MSQQEKKSYSNPYVAPLAKMGTQRNAPTDGAAASKTEESGAQSQVLQNNFMNNEGDNKNGADESPERPSDLVDIALQAKQTDARPGDKTATGIDERFSLTDSMGNAEK